jgi:hypothetical protein
MDIIVAIYPLARPKTPIPDSASPGFGGVSGSVVQCNVLSSYRVPENILNFTTHLFNDL